MVIVMTAARLKQAGAFFGMSQYLCVMELCLGLSHYIIVFIIVEDVHGRVQQSTMGLQLKSPFETI